MKKLSDITSKFKMTKFRVQLTAQAAIDVQKAMFSMGFRDSCSESGTLRVPRTETRGLKRTIHAFYIDEDCRIDTSALPSTFGDFTEYREIAILEVFNSAEEFKQLERTLRKQRKLEKSLAKDGWHINEGEKVATSLVSEVLFRNGSTRRGPDVAAIGSWSIPYGPNPSLTVIGYKLYSDEAVAPATVMLAEMVANIVKDAGGREVDADGYTVWTGTDCPLKTGDVATVKLRSGTLIASVSLENNCRWKDTSRESDIVAYKLTASAKPVDANGFTVWRGGERPVSGSTIVEIKFSSSGMGYSAAAEGLRWDWRNNGEGGDIVAYRIVKAESAEILDASGTVIGYTPVSEVTTGAFSGTLEAGPDTNPKRQYGITSIPLNLWSPLASAYGAVSLYCGSLKYGQGNYKATPVEASIYIAAALRHLLAWAEGEEFDPADGCPNLGGVLANVAILLDARAVGNLIDDRQIQGGYLKEREALKAIIKNLQSVHAGKTPKHYTIADNKAA